MTKYGKTKKLMKETGISKKEAQDFLRRAGWNYEDAKVLWAVSNLSVKEEWGDCIEKGGEQNEN